MHEVIKSIILIGVCFIACIAGAAIMRGCDTPKPSNNFVHDIGDYRYVMIEEQQFDRLIEAIESLARKETNEQTNQ